MTKCINLNPHGVKVGDRVMFNIIGENWEAKVVSIAKNKATVTRKATGGDYVIPLDILTKKLTLYRVPCSWEMYGFYEIEAESAHDAVSLAQEEDRPLPKEQDYVGASFQVIEEDFWNDDEYCQGEKE